MPESFTPKNTDKELYIKSSISFDDLIKEIKEHFGSTDGLEISSESILDVRMRLTRCLTYDLYDSSDYDNYIVITKI